MFVLATINSWIHSLVPNQNETYSLSPLGKDYLTFKLILDVNKFLHVAILHFISSLVQPLEVILLPK